MALSQDASPAEQARELVQHFAERADRGDETWLEDAIEAFLGLTVTQPQREICRSVVNNKRTAVSTANGLGKTYIVAAIANAWLTVKYPAVVFGTSGTGKKLYRTLCRPVEKLHDNALDGAGLPGEFKQQPPRIDYPDPEHFFEAASPSDAGELEGVHTAYTLAIIEETDKSDVTADTVDAMRSLVTDDQDRIIAVGNPPESEANVFHDVLRDGSSWNALTYSSFEGHNVQLERGNTEGEKIDGIASISAIRADWEDYHEEPWPGVDQAEAWTDPDSPEFRTDLSSRWYRRRGGITPPEDASTWRPWSISDVEAAYRRDVDGVRETPEALGIDVARQVDETVATGLHGPQAVIEYTSQKPHPEQRRDLTEQIREWPDIPIEVDAIGKGEPLAEELDSRFPDVRMFGNNEKANDEKNYRYKWDEGLQLIGEWLRDGGSFDDSELYEELKVGARVLEFSERALASRGGKIIEATSKDELKGALGRSPDALDSLLMCLYAREYEDAGGKPSPVFGR